MKYCLALIPVLIVSSCASRHVDTSWNQSRARTSVSQVMHRQVANAVDAGDGDASTQSLRRKMAERPGDVEVRLALADHYKKLGFPELALEHYRLAADRFPSDHRVMLRLTQALADQGMAGVAAVNVESFLATHQPEGPELPCWLGILQDELGKHQVAESQHRRALSLSPSNAKLHNNLGYNLLLQGKIAEAAAELRRALALDPRNGAAHNNLAIALVRQGGDRNREEALAHWLAATGDKAAGHNNAAAVLMEQKAFAEAREELYHALRVNRNYGPALKNLETLAGWDGKPALLEVIPAPKLAADRRPERQAGAPLRKSIWKRFWQSLAGVESAPPRGGGVTLATKE